MRARLFKLFTILTNIIFLVLLAIFIEPPKSWQVATDWQILAVFVPLLMIFTYSVDIFLDYLPRSFIVGLGLMFIVVLQAIGQLTIPIALGILAAFILMAKLYPKVPAPKFWRRLTLRTKIPKLTKLGAKK